MDEQAHTNVLLENLHQGLPGSPQALLAFATDLERRGLPEQAFALLRSAVDLRPDATSLRREFALRCLGEGDFASALLHMNAFVAAHPQAGDAYGALAFIHAGLGDDLQAQGCLHQAQHCGVPHEQLSQWHVQLFGAMPAPQEPAPTPTPTPPPQAVPEELEDDTYEDQLPGPYREASRPIESLYPQLAATTVISDVSGLPNFQALQLAAKDAAIRRRRNAKIAMVSAAALVTMLASWFMVANAQHDRLAAVLAEVESDRLADSYTSYQRALANAQGAEEQTRVLPSLLDGLVFGVLPTMAGNDVAGLRAELRDQQIELAAVIAWRFDAGGARQGVDASSELDQLTAARYVERIYDTLLAGDFDVAIDNALHGRKLHAEHGELVEALAEAVLADEAAARRRFYPISGLDTMLDAALEEGASTSARRRLLLARLAIQGGDPAKAMMGLGAILKEHPQHFDAQIERALALSPVEARRAELVAAMRAVATSEQIAPHQRARAYHTLGLITIDADEEAQSYFRQAIEAAPARAVLYPALIDLHIREARYDEATSLLKTMAEHCFDKHAESLAVRTAKNALLTGKAKEAPAVLDKVTLWTKETKWMQGLVHLELGDEKAAHTAFDVAAAAKNGVFPRATAFAVYTGDADDAAKELRALAKTHPNDIWILRAAALGIMREAKRASTARLQDRLFKEARGHLRAALALQPTDVFLRYDLCAVEIALGALKPAEKACTEAFEGQAAHRRGALHLVRLRLNQGQYQEAIALRTQIVAHHSADKDFELSAVQVEALTGLRRFEEATEELDRWVGSEHEESLARLVLKARIALAQYQYEEVKDFAQRARAVAPDDHEAGVLFAQALVRTDPERWEEADEILRGLLSSPQLGPRAWMALGELRKRQERYPDATVNLTRAGERFDNLIAPARHQVLVNTELAMVWQARHNWDHARVERHLTQARAQAAEHEIEVAQLLVAEARFQLGKRGGERGLAREALEKASELDPLLCETWPLLQRVYEADKARQQLRALRAKIPASCK
ncbi:MAG: hypothetical protein H0U74_23825 [Bradymonadaceae bacterium]|nr:hypothetical protein [Lujinxingiaceae bacterium]